MDDDAVIELSPDYKVTASSGVVKSGTIFLIIGAVLLILLVLIMFVSFLVWNKTSVTTVTVLDPVEGLCHGTWKDGICECKNGQSGVNCNLQERGFYLYTGAITTTLPGMSQHVEDNLRSCQERCNSMEGCTAVQWQHDTCTLLTQASLSSNETVYAPITQKGLYVKELADAVFSDRVFLAARRIDIPNAYSQVISTKGYDQLFLYSVATLPYLPQHIVAPANVVGIFARNTFTVNVDEVKAGNMQSLPLPSDDVLYLTSFPRGRIDIPGWSSPVTVFFYLTSA